MARVRAKARILETSASTASPFNLAGAVDTSHNSFASLCANGDTIEVTVVEPAVAFWTGIATFNTGPNRITLTSVEESKGSFGSGTKEIMAGPLAARNMFAEDISGAIVTTGSSTAYAVTSYRVYDTLARLNGNLIAFTPHTNSGATVTLNVDGLGNKPLRPAVGVELRANALIAGTPYLALYNHSDQVFYLHGFGVNINADDTFAANSDAFVPSQKAVKTYVDTRAFPAGTLMLFQQTSAPTGWTKQTTHNDKALRVVSGAASSGGTNAFSTVMAQSVVGSTTLSTSTMPAHAHASVVRTVGNNGQIFDPGAGGAETPYNTQTNGSTDSNGSGGSHNHTIVMSIQYVDLIIAAKN